MVAAALVLFGFICRIASIYFFWESMSAGFILMAVAAISLMNDKIKTKKQQGQNTTGEKIVIGLICFVLLIETVLYIVIPQTDAYAAAKHFLSTDTGVIDEIGTAKGFSIVPAGAISTSSGPQGTAGAANLFIIAKGSKRYKLYNLELYKAYKTDWIVRINR